MIKIQCRDCKRVTEYDEYDFNNDLTCRECGGYFDKVEDESEDYDDEDDDEDDYEDEDSDDNDDEDDEIEETTYVRPIADLPSLDEEVPMDKFDPEAKTRFD